MSRKRIDAVSLFSGAGGMDVGFAEAGARVVFANEMDHDAAEAYRSNPSHVEAGAMREGDVKDFMGEISRLRGVGLVFGGPPCQGFSVAGKMDPMDERSKLIWAFMDVVESARPRLFVMENVKALGSIGRWKPVRERLFARAAALGYGTDAVILNAADFGVPQARERFFFVGILGADAADVKSEFETALAARRKDAPTVRQALSALPAYGEPGNEVASTAAIRLAKHPILRKSPYQGSLLFNGRGRPVDLDAVAKTLPAQMGGNHTPIIDQALLDDPGAESWVAVYHARLLAGETTPEEAQGQVPASLRRLTVSEAAALQTFPADYRFSGRQNKRYRQVGNAVPCELARAVAESAFETLDELGEKLPQQLPGGVRGVRRGVGVGDEADDRSAQLVEVDG